MARFKGLSHFGITTNKKYFHHVGRGFVSRHSLFRVKIKVENLRFSPFQPIFVCFFRFLPPTYASTPLGRRTKNSVRNLTSPFAKNIRIETKELGFQAKTEFFPLFDAKSGLLSLFLVRQLLSFFIIWMNALYSAFHDQASCEGMTQDRSFDRLHAKLSS